MPPLKRGELRRAMRTTRDDETNFYHEILTYPFFFIQSSTPSYISSGLWAVFLDNCRVYTGKSDIISPYIKTNILNITAEILHRRT